MGKASRSKRSKLDPVIVEAVKHAGSIIRSPRIMKTFPTITIGEKSKSFANISNALSQVADQMGDVRMKHSLKDFPVSSDERIRKILALPEEDWRQGFQRAFRSKPFVKLVNDTISIAHKSFWKDDPKQALAYGGNTVPPDNDVYTSAIRSVHKELVSDPSSPKWLTLVLFCFARMIATNANSAFGAHEWTDFTFLWFDVERSLLAGEGQNFANSLLWANKEFFDGNLPEIVGSRVMHGLAEMTINAGDNDFFPQKLPFKLSQPDLNIPS